jgi:hypothetical protein
MTALQSSNVLVNLGGRDGLVAVPRRRRYSVLARLLGRMLDDRLAAGQAPESSRLLAVRAVQITSPRMRDRLARCWDELAARARHPQPPFDPRAPLAYSQVDAAADQIQQIGDVLRAPRPVSAQGVAIAASLLTTPESPAYRLGRGGDDLAAAIARAVAMM